MLAYNWRGHVIEVELRPFARFLWLAGGFVVTVDGRPFFPAQDEPISLGTRTEFRVEENGEFYPGIVQSVGVSVWTPRMRYTVWVAGEEIANDRQMPSRWYLSAFLWFILTVPVTVALVWVVLSLADYLLGE